MWDTLKKNVILPLGGRLGSLVAGALVPYGVHAQSADMLGIGIVGIGLVSCDLIASYINRRASGGK